MEKILKTEPNYSFQFFGGVSKDGIDFLKKLLVKNPEKRLSAYEAYLHPWIQRYLEQSRTISRSRS
jgi:serine/threonine protein kinase